MDIQVDYYKLFSEKRMGDNSVIPKNQELILIREDRSDGTLFFETHNDDCKKLFWANTEEVEFVESILENWSEEKIIERNSYINGEFL